MTISAVEIRKSPITRRPVPLILAASLFLLNMADLFVTIYLLGQGAAEQNPIALAALAVGGIPALAALKVAVSAGSCNLVLRLYERSWKAGLTALAFGNAALMLVVGWNLYQLSLLP